MQALPKTLNHREAARLLGVHPRTIKRAFNIRHVGKKPDVNVKAFVKAYGIDEPWLLDAIEGRDFAVPSEMTARYLGIQRENQRQQQLHAGILSPVAKWSHGTRYSAKNLGMMIKPPVETST